MQTISVIDKDDAEQQLTIAHPIALLWVAASKCSSFSKFFLAKLKETPPSIDKPWRLVAYTDEVTPGNPLAQKNNRKFQAFYWSFLEFGVSALSREEAWFTATTEYSVHVSGLSAGLSQVVGSIFKLFFSEGINLAVTGVLLHFDGHTPVRLWAVLGGMLQDGGAHKAVWHSRGDSASKFCILCKNVFDEESEIVDADGTNLLSCNCLEVIPAASKIEPSGDDVSKTEPSGDGGTLDPWAQAALQAMQKRNAGKAAAAKAKPKAKAAAVKAQNAAKDAAKAGKAGKTLKVAAKAKQEVKVKEQVHEVAKPGILKAMPKAGEGHPAAVNYNGGVIYTCVPQHKFRCLKVRGDNYSEISKAWGTKRTRQQAWKECIDAVDAHHACHQPKKGKAK